MSREAQRRDISFCSGDFSPPQADLNDSRVVNIKNTTMKKILTATLITLGLLLTCTTLISQPPPPPADHGVAGNQNADNGAPIGGGLFILLGLGAVYGGKKLFDLQKDSLKND